MWQSHPESGYLGEVAYRSPSYELGLVDLGVIPRQPVMRLGNDSSGEYAFGVHLAQVVTVGSAADVPEGTQVCQSGWAASTQSIGGYRCGQTGQSYGVTSVGLDSIDGHDVIDNGDSGAPVWQPLPDGTVRLVGFVASCLNALPCQHGLITRVSAFATRAWSGDEVAPGFSQSAGGWVVTG